ncbi:hypothetical protein SESBI_24218 [Sesbania bispinosa]|nr:hypothetical protein SESBI_24218 [Sesbania bispinosa]
MDESRFSKTIKDVSTTEGGWRYDRFSHYLPSHTVEEIVSHMAGNNDVGMDRIIWKHSHDGTFSTKIAYERNSCMQSHRVPRHPRVIIHWTPLQEGWLKWNLDGSICGQSGCVASGGALRDLSGKWIFGFARNVGCASVTLLNYGPSRMKSRFLYHWETHMSGWRAIQLHAFRVIMLLMFTGKGTPLRAL